MTIDERLDWLKSIVKCTDNLATEDVRRMVAHHARYIKDAHERLRTRIMECHAEIIKIRYPDDPYGKIRTLGVLIEMIEDILDGKEDFTDA